MYKKSFHRGVALITCFCTSLAASLFLTPIAAAHPPLQERISALTSQIRKEPGNAELYLMRGKLYSEHSDWNAAQDDFKRAAELDPNLAEINLYLGQMFLASGQPGLAEKTLKLFILQKPDHSAARAAHARALLRLGRLAEATEEYTNAIRLQPNPSPELYIERAKALMEESKENVDKALSGLNEGLQRLGQPVTLQLYAIDLEMRKNRFDAALSRLEQITSRSPRKEAWLVRRGEILEKAGRDEDARTAYTAVLALIKELPAHRQNTPAIIQIGSRASDLLKRLDAAKNDCSESDD